MSTTQDRHSTSISVGYPCSASAHRRMNKPIDVDYFRGTLPFPKDFRSTPSPTISNSSSFSSSIVSSSDTGSIVEEPGDVMLPRSRHATSAYNLQTTLSSPSPSHSVLRPAVKKPVPTSIPMARSLPIIRPSLWSYGPSSGSMPPKVTLSTKARNPHMILPLPHWGSKLPVPPPSPPFSARVSSFPSCFCRSKSMSSPARPKKQKLTLPAVDFYQCDACLFTGAFHGVLSNSAEALRLHCSSQGHKQSMVVYPGSSSYPHHRDHAHKKAFERKPYDRPNPILHMPRPHRPSLDRALLKRQFLSPPAVPQHCPGNACSKTTHHQRTEKPGDCTARGREREVVVVGGEPRRSLEALAEVAVMQLGGI
ncbi:hypothetical protein IAR50_003157 [Cryptococcus sp. DSM 104548]